MSTHIYNDWEALDLRGHLSATVFRFWRQYYIFHRLIRAMIMITRVTLLMAAVITCRLLPVQLSSEQIYELPEYIPPEQVPEPTMTESPLIAGKSLTAGKSIPINEYRQVSNIRRTKSHHLRYSRIVLRLSLANPLKPDVKSRMKM